MREIMPVSSSGLEMTQGTARGQTTCLQTLTFEVLKEQECMIPGMGRQEDVLFWSDYIRRAPSDNEYSLGVK